MTERWRPVLGHPRYEVSDAGRFKRDGELTEPVTLADGRLRVSIDGRRRFLSHVVLETFVGRRPKGKECCHRDDNPANNALDNIRWGTRKSNITDAVRNGRRKRRRVVAGKSQPTKTHCVNGHEYTPENTVQQKGGVCCRRCKNDQRRERRSRGQARS